MRAVRITIATLLWPRTAYFKRLVTLSPASFTSLLPSRRCHVSFCTHPPARLHTPASASM
ncbi:hypothetical protein BJV82DRAFT_620599 [Fennellomyces sp. T-0311]|nr:hypothetical protein BJV82DRAFT_620599 [Fennellomyces sp. T-0311]